MAFPGERILQKAKERPVRKGVGGKKLDDGAGELCSANAKLQRNKGEGDGLARFARPGEPVNQNY